MCLYRTRLRSVCELYSVISCVRSITRAPDRCRNIAFRRARTNNRKTIDRTRDRKPLRGLSYRRPVTISILNSFSCCCVYVIHSSRNDLWNGRGGFAGTRRKPSSFVGRVTRRILRQHHALEESNRPTTVVWSENRSRVCAVYSVLDDFLTVLALF